MKRTSRREGLRREMMLAAAAELFGKKGFRGTGIEDIGAAVGTTGPAIYRHFASKEAILVELLERAVGRSRQDVLSVRKRRMPPERTLSEIVRKAVAHVIETSDLVVVAEQELPILSPELRRRIARGRAAILREWSSALQAVRPELVDAEARSICLAVFALITSLPRTAAIAPAAARPVYTGMALAALLAPPTD
jgi:AcrR family transcriptional regulator